MTSAPRLVASTGDVKFYPATTTNGPPSIDAPIAQVESHTPDTDYFAQAQWTADGTTLITNSADYSIRTYIVPPDVLDERESPHQLFPYSVIPAPEAVYATALYPGFHLPDASTTLILSSLRDHPIRLNSALHPALYASYPLMNENTEAYICPNSLIFAANGSRFISGSDSLISIFDVSRTGSGPLSLLPTIPSKRTKNLGGGIGMKGIISALSVEPSSSILAAGTFTGYVGLYGAGGEGEMIGVFPLGDVEARRNIGGNGVTQVRWSPCGKYLYVIERMSDGILVYDIRDTGQLLGYLTGRRAMTNQRMGIDISATNEDGGHEIWAGGTDGCARVWTDPHNNEGAQGPTWEWTAHQDVITSAVVHPMGIGIVATCSGQRHSHSLLIDDDESSDSETDERTEGHLDNSLRIWQMVPSSQT